jgi:muconate cycloisomerase
MATTREGFGVDTKPFARAQGCSAMKILRVTGYEVVVPVHEGVVNSADYGPAVFDEVPKIILEAETDEGITGIGETPRGVSEQRVRDSLRKLERQDLANLCLQDLPIHDLSQDDLFAHEHPNRPHRLIEFSFGSPDDSGVHALVLDLIGKKHGLPAHALFGGAYRKRVRVDYWMGRMTPEDSARICIAAKRNGYRGVKCKCALEDDNVDRALAVREACGSEFKMTFDPNSRFYRYGQAIDMLKKLSAVGNVGCVEDPFAKQSLSEYRLLRSHGLFPVALHTGSGATLLEAVKQEACDCVNLGDLPWRVRDAASVCWLANLPTWHGSGVDLGILEALVLHLCAATRSMTLPCDVFGRMIRRHNLIDDPLPVSDGTMAVPAGPGLGVKLDRDALDQFTIRTFTIDCSH